MPDPVKAGEPAAPVAPILPSDANADGTPSATPPDGGAPKLLAGKYKSDDELGKGYQELATKLQAGGKLTAPLKLVFKDTAALEAEYVALSKLMGAAPAPAAAAGAKPVVPGITEPTAEEAAAAAAAAATGGKVNLNFAEFTQELTQNGVLSEASYKKLADAGLPKEMVDDYIEGQTARTEKIRNDIFSVVGGEKTYGVITEWAKTGIAPAEIAAFNKALTGTVDEAKLALAGLHAKYKAANGSSPKIVMGEGAGSGAANTGSAYKSIAEHVADVKDPRYKKDEAYRNAVAAKLARSKIY